MTTWHKWPEEAPPSTDFFRPVLVARRTPDDEGEPDIELAYNDNGDWRRAYTANYLDGVTHWAELPAPPECCIDCGGYNIEEQTCLDCQAKDLAESETTP